MVDGFPLHPLSPWIDYYSLPGLFTSVPIFLKIILSLIHVVISVYSILLLDNIPLYEYTTILKNIYLFDCLGS